jgi:simple sugar transport system ATP-binding protein
MSNRVTILRAGKKVVTINASEATAESLARMMMGEIAPSKKASIAQRSNNEKRAAVLEVANIKVNNDQNRLLVNGVSFELHAGEILGVAGVDGSGQRELAEAIMGLRQSQAGVIKWELNSSPPRKFRPTDKSGQRIMKNPLAAFIRWKMFWSKQQKFVFLKNFDRRRIGFIPSDRMAEAFVAEFSVAENLLLARSNDPRFRCAGLLSPKKIETEARQILENFNVLSKGLEQKLRELSGGNQQKFLLGRSLSTNPDVLVAMNPTWGVDVAATAVIHQRLLQMRERGGAILLFSTDLDEIYALSDRFLVVHAGRLMGWATTATSSIQVGLWMAGRA